MKNISSTLLSTLSNESLTLIYCYKITLQDGTILGFCDHDQDISFESQNYIATSAVRGSAIEASSDLAVDDMEISGIIDSNIIKEQDVLAGRYDQALVEVFILDYTDLSAGKMIVQNGYIGEIKIQGERFVAEIRGLSQKLSQPIGKLYSPNCRAKLGDSKCSINISNFSHSGTVTSVTSRAIFTDSNLSWANSGYWNYGIIEFTSGANNGIKIEVKNSSTDGSFILALSAPFDISIGDEFIARAGCDKRLSSCINKFSNAVNFRGEPHIPGIDKMLKTSTTI